MIKIITTLLFCYTTLALSTELSEQIGCDYEVFTTIQNIYSPRCQSISDKNSSDYIECERDWMKKNAENGCTSIIRSQFKTIYIILDAILEIQNQSNSKKITLNERNRKINELYDLKHKTMNENLAAYQQFISKVRDAQVREQNYLLQQNIQLQKQKDDDVIGKALLIFSGQLISNNRQSNINNSTSTYNFGGKVVNCTTMNNYTNCF